MSKTLKQFLMELKDITIVRKLIHLLDRLWVRILVIGLLALVAIGVARLVEPLIPPGIKEVVGAGSVGQLLMIIANSMLAVTTFSLTVMVSVFRSASTQWTPRVHRLMLDDETTQNTLATLVGAYIYALASIILLNTQLFMDDQVVVLFFFTILILILIVIAIVRWIVHLQTLGSLVEVTRRIEEKTAAQFKQRMMKPCLGANALTSGADIPKDAVPFEALGTGYMQHMFEGALSELAEEEDIDIYLPETIGSFVYKGTPIAYVSRMSPNIANALGANLIIGDLRTFEQDPRFGLIVLGEIGSKALSPGINDPGTAIDVLGRMSRIFEGFPSELGTPQKAPTHSRLWVPPLVAVDLIEDGFEPIARDGGAIIEVQLAFHQALRRLSQHPDEELAEAAIDVAQRAFDRSETLMQQSFDLDRLRKATPAKGASG